MSDYITKLETYTDLEVSIMRATKIHKVLRAIVKLEGIPRDAEFEFKHRSRGVLAGWTKALTAAEDGAGAEPEEKEKTQNGVREEQTKGETTPADDKAGEKTVEKDAEVVAEKTEEESTEAAETLKASGLEDAEPETKPETESESEPKKPEEEGETEAVTDEA